MPPVSRPGALLPSADHAPSYYAATLRESVMTQPFDGSVRSDVCVIGGGYTGLATALHLARRGSAVVVLEQARLGWGASGRNGGQVHVGLRRDQPWFESRVGPSGARRYWQLALAARAHLDWLISSYAIDCEFRPGLLHANHRARFGAATRRHVEHLQRAYDYPHIRFVEREELRSLLATEAYHSATFDARGGHLHALNFALGIARAAVSHGARLHEGIEATALRRDGSGWCVSTAHGEVRASQVVLACNGYLRGLAPRVERHVMPINNYIAVSEVLGAERAASLIRNGAAVSDSRFVVNYFRLTPDRRLLFGGGENYRYRFPRDIGAFVRPHLLAIFPQLRDSRLEYAWGGTLAITPTRMPLVQELEPGLINASGYSGLGVLLAPYTGKAIADALHGEREAFELLGQLPPPAFPGGVALRWPTLVAAMSYHALRDRL
jgi:gamma-glutamylputrescine oxidase